MSNSVSPLDGFSTSGAVRVRDGGLVGMITIRADLSDPEIGALIEATTGLSMPSPRAITQDGERALAWMSPDETLWMLPHASAPTEAHGLAQRLASHHALVLDTSDARAVIDVEGAGAREVLAKLCPVDLHPSQFQEGEIRRTRLAQIACAFWFEGPDRLRVLCFRSQAKYAADALALCACDDTLPGVLVVD